MTHRPRTTSCGCCEASSVEVRATPSHATDPSSVSADPFDLAARATASRTTRRALLLGTAATLTAGAVGLGGLAARRRPSALVTPGSPLTASLAGEAVPLPIEEAATVAAPARRLRRSGGLMFPMGPEPRCDILDNFGDPRSGGRRHEGIDILATLDQEVYAVADGELVNQADASASLSGNAWGLTADDGTYYFFAHLSRFAEGLALGDRVRQGQVIGYVGDTGNPGVGNYHLHFEVHPGGLRSAAVDPLPLLEVPIACSIT